MYELMFSVPDTYHTALRPVARRVVRSIMKDLGIASLFKDRVSFESFGETTATVSSTHRDPTITENTLTTIIKYSTKVDDMIWPVAGANIDYEQAAGTASLAAQLNKIVMDPIHGIYVTEYNKPVSMNMECTFVLIDIMDAMNILQKLNMYMTNGVAVMDLDFTYYMPAIVSETLYTMYKHIEPSGEGFKQWLVDNSDGLIEFNLNRDDMGDTAISIRKTYANSLYGISIGSSEPEPVGDTKSPDGYSINISVGCQFSLTNSLAVLFPIVINNILTESIFIQPERYVIKNADMDNIFFSLNEFKKAHLVPLSYMRTKRLPYYDNWQPPVLMGFTPFLINLVTLDDIDNPEATTVVNLEQEFVGLLPAVIDELRHIGLRVLSLNGHINLSVYANDTMISPSAINYDPLTTELTLTERDRTKAYRIVLSVDFSEFARINSLRILTANLCPQVLL